MEKVILVIEEFDILSEITNRDGKPFPPEEIKDKIQESINAFPMNAFNFRDEPIVIDDEEYRLLIITDNPESPDYNPALLEGLSDDIEALTADEGWYPESLDPAIADCILNFLDGNFDDEESDDAEFTAEAHETHSEEEDEEEDDTSDY